MNRRGFLSRILGVLIGVPVVASVISACGGSSNGGGGSGEDPDGDCSTGAPVEYLNRGHTHSELTLDADDIADMAPGNYRLLGEGGNDHDHRFALTAEHFRELKDEGSVTISGDNEGHGHIIEIRC